MTASAFVRIGLYILIFNKTLEMDPDALVLFLGAYLDKLQERGFNCPMFIEMHKYRETSRILKACGYETQDLDEAIKDAMQSIKKLKSTQEDVISNWKEKGVNFIVYKPKELDEEAALLQ